MFCSGCGTQIQEGLNYCNRCGNRVPKGETASAAEHLAASVGYVGGFGLIGFIFVILIMVKSGVAPDVLTKISFIYLSALFGICFLLIRQSNSGNRRNVNRVDVPAVEQASYLRPVTTAQLEEPKDLGIGTVTEHTTRALEEVTVERK